MFLTCWTEHGNFSTGTKNVHLISLSHHKKKRQAKKKTQNTDIILCTNWEGLKLANKFYIHLSEAIICNICVLAKHDLHATCYITQPPWFVWRKTHPKVFCLEVQETQRQTKLGTFFSRQRGFFLVDAAVKQGRYLVLTGRWVQKGQQRTLFEKTPRQTKKRFIILFFFKSSLLGKLST